jgi:ABC-type transporter MlaC component
MAKESVVIVTGASQGYIRSYRSQFNEILQRGTIEDLFEKLEKSTDN